MPNPFDQYSPEFILAAGRRSIFGEKTRRGVRPAFGPTDLGGLGPIANEYLPMLMRMTGTERATMQFSASQNLFERISDMQDAGKMSAIATQATRIDAGRVQNWSDNIQKTLSGTNELDPTQLERSQQIADFFAKHSGMILKFAGEDNYGAMFGNQSGTVMGMRLQRAFADAKDPMTAAYGYKPSYTAGLTDAMMGQMYGTEGARHAMRGIEATKVGGIVEYLAARGELGRSIGSQSIERQSAAANEMNFDDETIRRMVRRTPEIAKVLEEQGTPGAELLAKTEAQVRSTLGQLRDPGSGITKEQLGEMPGGEQIVQELQGKQIKDKMHSLAKSVRTMQEIFGDEGRPDAPMQEIMKAISNFTQGASRSMTDDKVNAILRSARNVSKRAGMTMDELLQAGDVAKERIVSRGGHASMGLPVAMRAAEMTQGQRQGGAFEHIAFGSGGIDETMRRNTMELANAVTSNYAEQRAVFGLLEKQGNLPIKAGSRLEAYKAAADRGDTSYTYKGQTYSMDQTDGKFNAMLMDGAGLTRTEVMNIRKDKQGILEMKSQQEALDYSGDQQRYDKTKQFTNAMVESFDANANIDFAGLAIEGNTQAKAAVTAAAVRNMDQALREQANSPEMADVAKRSALYKKSAIEGLAKAFETELGMTPAAAKAAAAKRFQNEKGLSGQVTDAAAQSVALNPDEYFKDTNAENVKEQEAQKRRTVIENREADAGSMFNEGSLPSRIAKLLSTADKDTTVDKVVGQLLGVMDSKQIALFEGLALEKGAVSELAVAGEKLTDLKQKALDSTDPEDKKRYFAHVDLIEGLAIGGDTAAKLYEQYKGTEYLKPDQLKLLQKASLDQKGITERFKEAGIVEAAVGSDTLTAMQKQSTRIADIKAGDTINAGFRAEIDDYMPSLDRNLNKMMQDENTVKQLGKGGYATLKTMFGHRDAINEILTKHKLKLSDLGDTGKTAKFTSSERETIAKSLTGLSEGFKDTSEAAETFHLPGTKRNTRQPMSEQEFNDSRDFIVTRNRGLQAEQPKKTDDKPKASDQATAPKPKAEQQKQSPYATTGSENGITSWLRPWLSQSGDSNSTPPTMKITGAITLKDGNNALADFDAIQQNAITT